MGQAETTAESGALDFSRKLAALIETSEQLMAQGQTAGVSAEDIAEVLYIAARLFSAKTDKQGETAWPLRLDALNATETVVLVTALLKAANINLFDLAIWYRRP